jgi:hypothetical protein
MAVRMIAMIRAGLAIDPFIAGNIHTFDPTMFPIPIEARVKRQISCFPWLVSLLVLLFSSFEDFMMNQT